MTIIVTIILHAAIALMFIFAFLLIDKTTMNSLERWFLKRLCWKLVKQGYSHKKLITEYYRYIREAAEEEFTEDNKPTLDHFMTECHEDANKMVDDRNIIITDDVKDQKDG